MQTETLTYDADGVTLKSRLFFEPGAGRRAGVVVFPEIFGLGEHALTRAESVAKLGYVALACDIHGDARLFTSLDDSLKAMAPLYADRKRMRARGLGGLKALAARPEVDAARLAAIGFCFGGTMSLELARGGADLKSVVGFHSGLATNAPAPADGVKPRILVCIGADDPFIVPDERAAFEAEMRSASFTARDADKRGNLGAMRYSAEADRRSWAAMQEMFAETLDTR
jgi:dienelactone hydrolase